MVSLYTTDPSFWDIPAQLGSRTASTLAWRQVRHSPKSSQRRKAHRSELGVDYASV